MALKNKNKRIGTTTNLESGGSYDLLLVGYPDGFPEGRVLFNIDVTPRKVTGIQKVAQTFLKLLLTSKGSNVIYPSQGTVFPNLPSLYNILLNDGILYAEISAAVNDAAGQTKNSLNTVGSDTSSMLDRVEVIGLDTGTDSVVMFLSLQTLDGVSANIAVPFPELDLQ